MANAIQWAMAQVVEWRLAQVHETARWQGVPMTVPIASLWDPRQAYIFRLMSDNHTITIRRVSDLGMKTSCMGLEVGD